MEKLATDRPLLQSFWTQFKIAFTRPGSFFLSRPFGIVWTLYAGTYIAANVTGTITCNLESAAIAKAAIFFVTTATNVPLGCWKDVRFAQIYMANNVPVGNDSVVPKRAVQPCPPKVASPVEIGAVPALRGRLKGPALVFLARDAITIFGSFTLAPRIAELVPDRVAAGQQAKSTLSQLTVPALTQFVATPIHLLGLDLYHKQRGGYMFATRLEHIRPLLPSTIAIRCIRVLPAFGFGVIANTKLRNYFHSVAHG